MPIDLALPEELAERLVPTSSDEAVESSRVARELYSATPESVTQSVIPGLS